MQIKSNFNFEKIQTLTLQIVKKFNSMHLFQFLTLQNSSQNSNSSISNISKFYHPITLVLYQKLNFLNTSMSPSGLASGSSIRFTFHSTGQDIQISRCL